MAVKAGELMDVLEDLAPLALQETWDNSGLQVGSPEWQLSKVLLTLDVTPQVMEYAISQNCGFILAHHPLIFHKLSCLNPATATGLCIARALAAEICVYAMHTNLDLVPGGVSDVLAVLLGLQNIMVLDKRPGKYRKLAVFVPESHLDPVRRALGDAGAGSIGGKYSHCTFATPGQGQFLPLAGSNPWRGSPKELTEIFEYRLESIILAARLPAVLKAVLSVHPYEEVAYDIIPVEDSGELGMGRIGCLRQPQTLAAFATFLGKKLGCSSLRVCGAPERLVSKIAVCGGSGSDLIYLAHRQGADALVTGDVGYHAALEAAQLGLAVIDPGHYFSEYPVLSALEAYIRRHLPGLALARFPGQGDPMWIKVAEQERGGEI